MCIFLSSLFYEKLEAQDFICKVALGSHLECTVLTITNIGAQNKEKSNPSSI